MKGIRKVLLHSPFLERFYLLQASRWLWDLCMGSSETYNFGLFPAVPFSWLNFLLSGVAHFLHCPQEPTCSLPSPVMLRNHQFSRQPQWTAFKSTPMMPALCGKLVSVADTGNSAFYLIRQRGQAQAPCSTLGHQRGWPPRVPPSRFPQADVGHQSTRLPN